MISSFATLMGKPDGHRLGRPDEHLRYDGSRRAEHRSPGQRRRSCARGRVGRYLADQRYLDGVKTAVRSAYNAVAVQSASPNGYPTPYGCNPNMSALAALTASDSAYIDCPGGITLDGEIGAGRIYFHGFIKQGELNMPNATYVYIDNTKNNGDISESHQRGDHVEQQQQVLHQGDRLRHLQHRHLQQCADQLARSRTSRHSTGSPQPAGGSLLRLCNTTGHPAEWSARHRRRLAGGCLPASWGTMPTSTPCTTPADSAAGNGFLHWTVPPTGPRPTSTVT